MNQKKPSDLINLSACSWMELYELLYPGHSLCGELRRLDCSAFRKHSISYLPSMHCIGNAISHSDPRVSRQLNNPTVLFLPGLRIELQGSYGHVEARFCIGNADRRPPALFLFSTTYLRVLSRSSYRVVAYGREEAGQCISKPISVP